MAKLNALLTPAPPRDFTDRLNRERPGVGTADPRMVVQPFVDPGYAMPNVDSANLNQSPGLEVEGWLPASSTNSFALPPRPGPMWKRLPELRAVTPNIDPRAEIQPADPGNRMPADYGDYYADRVSARGSPWSPPNALLIELLRRYGI